MLQRRPRYLCEVRPACDAVGTCGEHRREDDGASSVCRQCALVELGAVAWVYGCIYAHEIFPPGINSTRRTDLLRCDSLLPKRRLSHAVFRGIMCVRLAGALPVVGGVFIYFRRQALVRQTYKQ